MAYVAWMFLGLVFALVSPMLLLALLFWSLPDHTDKDPDNA